jgi:S-adenosylmethionine hydrolase
VTRKLRDTKTRGRDSTESGSRVALSAARLAPSASRRSLITLLTDFGTADYFTGAMKGVILSLDPQANVIDLTHDVPPQDVHAAAFTLLAAYRSFPAATIHVAVVDPGVGSERAPLLIEAGEQFFVGPDNGIFSYVCEREGKCRAYQLNRKEFFREPVSSTFHGRDVFAPVAAALSKGVKPELLGDETEEYVRLESLAPQRRQSGELQARIIHIDRFGNCISNITPEYLTTDYLLSDGAKAVLSVNGKRIKSFKRFFGDGSARENELFGIWGSAGFLEIAARNTSAAKLLKAKRDQIVLLSSPP